MGKLKLEGIVFFMHDLFKLKSYLTNEYFILPSPSKVMIVLELVKIYNYRILTSIFTKYVLDTNTDYICYVIKILQDR